MTALSRNNVIFTDLAMKLFTFLEESNVRCIENSALIGIVVDTDMIFGSQTLRTCLIPLVSDALIKETACLRFLVDSLVPGLTSNLFTSKESDMGARIQILKKLSYIAICSPEESIQAFWLLIQERLVELVKTSIPVVTFYVFMFLRCSLFKVNSLLLLSLLPIVHPIVTCCLEDIIKTDQIGNDMLIQLSGVCCFLDALYLLHPNQALSYFWGVASIDGRGLLKSVISQHGIEDDFPQKAKRSYLIPMAKHSDIKSFSPFFYGIYERLKTNDSCLLTEHERKSLMRITIEELN